MGRMGGGSPAVAAAAAVGRCLVFWCPPRLHGACLTVTGGEVHVQRVAARGLTDELQWPVAYKHTTLDKPWAAVHVPL